MAFKSIPLLFAFFLLVASIKGGSNTAPGAFPHGERSSPPPPVNGSSPTPPVPSPPISPPKTTAECSPLCEVRCKLHYKKICLRACTTCCLRCKCVPPGQYYGNRVKCGTCYANMTSHGGRLKCP
ncbi:gibberellin-regulated protein 14-like [Lycium barbarum]|uniref:gibberellin-regulated protein 14-like n=1 Tax=Lycium barbarum TaxID=112863 RepID=UPI00293E82A0|nr:gibberellin-regulated protein 14-like [Lycium barbarum]